MVTSLLYRAARDFYRRIGKHYGKLEQWIFEPHVAEQIFLQYLNAADIKVIFNITLCTRKMKTAGTGIRLRNTQTGEEFVVTAKMFIDCSYEGDLMAKAGVLYK